MDALRWIYEHEENPHRMVKVTMGDVSWIIPVESIPDVTTLIPSGHRIDVVFIDETWKDLGRSIGASNAPA